MKGSRVPVRSELRCADLIQVLQYRPVCTSNQEVAFRSCSRNQSSISPSDQYVSVKALTHRVAEPEPDDSIRQAAERREPEHRERQESFEDSGYYIQYIPYGTFWTRGGGDDRSGQHRHSKSRVENDRSQGYSYREEDLRVGDEPGRATRCQVGYDRYLFLFTFYSHDLLDLLSRPGPVAEARGDGSPDD
jgi:hypothetical protein